MRFVASRTESAERTEKTIRRSTTPLEKAKAWFSDDLRKVLTFESEKGNAILKTRFFLAKGRWEKITEIVQKHGGKWVSKGKKSHWSVPLE